MKADAIQDDSQLVEACINGDLAAWSRLVQKYGSLIRTAIYIRLKKYGIRLDTHDTDDIFQSVLSSVWENNKLGGVRNRGNISYWLATVAGNMALAYMRKKALVELPMPMDLSELIPSSEPGLCEKLARDELSTRVESALESLSDKEKLISKLLLYHDKKYHEIAAILGLPAGTVSSYIRRVKEKLKNELKDFL